jgi:methionyl aminopeptidase
MIQIKSQREIEIMARGGEILAETVHMLEESVRPGMTTMELDKVADDFIRSHLCDSRVQGAVQFSRQHLHVDQSGNRARDSVQ